MEKEIIIVSFYHESYDFTVSNIVGVVSSQENAEELITQTINGHIEDWDPDELPSYLIDRDKYSSKKYTIDGYKNIDNDNN